MLTHRKRMRCVFGVVAVLASAWALSGGSATLADKGGGGHGGGGGGDPGTAPTHQFQNLWTFPDTDGTSGIEDFNASGMVVGVASGRPFLIVPEDVDGDGQLNWFQDDGSGGNLLMRDLGFMLPGGATGETWPMGINDSGCIVGVTSEGPENGRAFLIVPEDTTGDGEPDTWFRNGGGGRNLLMTDLTGAPDDGSLVLCGGWDINNAGLTVGQYWLYPTPPGPYTPFIVAPEDTNGDGSPDLWFRDDDGDGVNDLMTQLGTGWLVGGAAETVNNAGWVIGSLVNGYGSPAGWFAVIPEDTDGDGVGDDWLVDADPNDGANDLMFVYNDDLFAPSCLNDLGQFVRGRDVWQIDPTTGVIYLVDSLPEAPGHLGPASANALNNSGGVVGRAFKQKGQYYSMGMYVPLYWQDGVLYNLFDLMVNDDGIDYASATHIDDSGRIYGDTRDRQGRTRTAFIAVPIPPAP